MRNDKDNIIVKLSFEFSVQILNFCDRLNRDKRFPIASQLLRWGTSIGANIREAQNAESKADFIHKMKMAAKESDETHYWLLLIKETYDYKEVDDLLNKLEIIFNILGKIISTSKKYIK